MIKLYHGTNVWFGEIDLNKSKKHKDFSRGFYLTEDRNQARRLAEQRCLVDGGDIVILSFDFDAEQAKADSTLRLLMFDGYTREWAEFINLNRNMNNGRQKFHHYDIVYGPIADDKVGLQIKLFNQRIIDIDTLQERLKFVKPTYQYYFGTEKALKYLKKNDGER